MHKKDAMKAIPSGLSQQKVYWGTMHTKWIMLMGGMCYNTVHRTLLHLGLHSSDSLWWSLSTVKSTYNGHMNVRTGPGKKIAWSDESHFSFTSHGQPCTCASFTWSSDGTRMHFGGQQASSRNVLLGNPGSSHSCGCKFSTSLHNSSVQGWFEEHEWFKVLPWPPNLNRIEHLWDVMAKPVRCTMALHCYSSCRVHALVGR